MGAALVCRSTLCLPGRRHDCYESANQSVSTYFSQAAQVIVVCSIAANLRHYDSGIGGVVWFRLVANWLIKQRLDGTKETTHATLSVVRKSLTRIL